MTANFAAIRANDFGNLAERREWLASLPIPKNDSDIDPVLGCPTLARLTNAGDTARAAALATWVARMRPQPMPMSLSAANDNQPTYDGWERAVWAEPGERKEEFSQEREFDIRPTVNELVAATGRVSVVKTRRANGTWSEPERRETQLVVGKHRGRSRRAVMPSEIVGWHDRNGVERRARVALGLPKGGGKKRRATQDVSRYLNRPGTPFPPQWLARGGGRYWEKTAQSKLAQIALNEAIANTETLPPITRCPTVIAKGAHWLGGVVGRSGKAGGRDASSAEALMARAHDAVRLRRDLGAQRAKILDLATTRMSARQIGVEFGYSDKYAERWAVAAINEALDRVAA